MIRLLTVLMLLPGLGVVYAQAPCGHRATTSGIAALRQDGTTEPDPQGTHFQPLSAGQKFIRSTQDVFYPVPLAAVGLGAAYGQLTDSPSEWGQGAKGFGRRYASAFAGNLTHRYLAFGLESVLKEDPRYFPSSDHSFGGRVKNALRQAYMARKDDGSEGVAYARIGSALGAGLIANAWQPRSTRSVGYGIGRGFVILGIDTGVNLAQEFVPFLRHINH